MLAVVQALQRGEGSPVCPGETMCSAPNTLSSLNRSGGCPPSVPMERR